MVVRLDTHRLQTLDQVREFLAGSAGLALQPHRRADAYALVATTVQRFDYALCGKPDKGLLRRFLSQATGLSRAQVTRLLRQHRTTGAVTDRRGAPRRPFARRYTRADIGLLAETDALHGTLSGPATRALCARAWRLFGDGRFERLARISNGHLFSVNYFGRLATIILAGSAHHGLRSAARLADTVRGVTRAASGEFGAAAGRGRARGARAASAETSVPPLADEQRRSHHRIHAGRGGGPSDAAPAGLARGRHSTRIAQPRSSRSPVHAGVAAPGPIAIPAAASRASTGASAAPVQRGGSGTSGSGRPSARVKRTAPASSSITRNPPSCTAR